MTDPLGPHTAEEKQLSKGSMGSGQKKIPDVLSKVFYGLAPSTCPAPPKIFL